MYYGMKLGYIRDFHDKFLEQNQDISCEAFEDIKLELKTDLTSLRKVVVNYYDTIFQYLALKSEEFQAREDYIGFINYFKSDHFIKVVHDPLYKMAKATATTMVRDIESKVANFWGPKLYDRGNLLVGLASLNSTDIDRIPGNFESLDYRFRESIQFWFEDRVVIDLELCLECYRFFSDTSGMCLRCDKQRQDRMDSSSEDD